MAEHSSKKRRHDRAAQRRVQRDKERARAARRHAAEKQLVTLRQRDRHRERASANPLKYLGRYENGATVFGEPMPAAFLGDRIKMYVWREWLFRSSHLAAV